MSQVSKIIIFLGLCLCFSSEASATTIAKIIVPTIAYKHPTVDSKKHIRLQPYSLWAHHTNQLLVLQTRTIGPTKWLQVQLPVRPNKSTAWIDANRVTLLRTTWKIVVHVRSRRLTVLHGGHVKQSFAVVVGASKTPTPVGLFALYEKVKQSNPNGFIGPWALHLTAFSNVLDNYGGGPGRIALHGRGGTSFADPLGSARSHGCVRMDNNHIRYLAAKLIPGTPVRIYRR